MQTANANDTAIREFHGPMPVALHLRPMECSVKTSPSNSDSRATGVVPFKVGLIFALILGWTDVRAAPVNDNFADRVLLVGTNVHTVGSNWGATTERGESRGHSVWWTWTAPVEGFFVIQLTGSPGIPIPMVFLGS